MLSSDAVIDLAHKMKQQGQPYALVTVVRCESPTSAKPGAKAIVDASGHIDGWVGGGCAQPAVIDTVKKALKDGQSRLIRVSPVKGAVVDEGVIDFGMTCHSGGTLDIFIDPIIPRPALLIIGVSPAAQALAVLAHRTGFAVSAAFPGADSELFPDAVQIIDGLELADLKTGLPAFIVVATQGKRDEQGLEAALESGCHYIAFIASERKAKRLLDDLKADGQSAEAVDAIIAPAGIDIAAVTPEEIALSVLAGLVKARREQGIVSTQVAVSAEEGKTMAVSSCCGGKAKKETVASTALDPICGMTVEVATAEFSSEYNGTAYYFCCSGCQRRFDKAPQDYAAQAGAVT